MALIPSSSVSAFHRYRNGGSRLPLAILLLLLFSVFVSFSFVVGRRFHSNIADDQNNDLPGHSSTQQTKDWREITASKHLRSPISKEVVNVIAAAKADLQSTHENLTTSDIRNSYIPNRKSLSVKRATTKGNGSNIFRDDHSQFVDTPAKQLRVERVKHNDEAVVKLENAAIEHSKFVDTTYLGKYSTWRKDHENDTSDATIRSIRDQIIMANVYLILAKMKNRLDLHHELQMRLKEIQHVLGEATTDSDLHQSSAVKINSMGEAVSKARQQLYDCHPVTEKLREMLLTADEKVRSIKKQSTFLSQLAAKVIPNAINCLSMRLTIDYNLLPPEKREFPTSDNLENPNLFHYALFSDNVLAASVVVNSTIINAKDPSKHVFHLVTDKLNYGAMKMWFLLNPPGKATIHVDNVDEMKWLNSSYCPALRQLETAAMKSFYHSNSIGSGGAANLKYRNPKYLSMLNHLRFYLPEMYPKLDKILFLDDDIVVQRDLTELWSVDLHGKVNGAVETCHKEFHTFDKYLNFSNPHIANNFDPNACGWAYGMNIFDLKEWKKNNITGIYHKWQNMNEDRVLWKLGTLPPGLLTFYGLTHALDKSWHVLGLGYNPSINKSDCERAAVVHYNGNLKPWLDLAMTKYHIYWTKYVKYDHPYHTHCNLSH